MDALKISLIIIAIVLLIVFGFLVSVAVKIGRTRKRKAETDYRKMVEKAQSDRKRRLVAEVLGEDYDPDDEDYDGGYSGGGQNVREVFGESLLHERTLEWKVPVRGAEPKKQEKKRVKDDSPYSGVMAILGQKYDSVRYILKIPKSAVLIWRETSVFCLKGAKILHYCWASSKNFYIFPQWESIEARLVAGAVTRYLEGDENKLETITIPISSIDQWIQLPDQTIGMVYKLKRKGPKQTMRLDGDALPVFEKHLSEKEHSYVMKNVYPKSPQQIKDVKNEFLKLKRAYKKGEITKEEFAAKKIKIVLTM